jgi:hypothetical protein
LVLKPEALDFEVLLGDLCDFARGAVVFNLVLFFLRVNSKPGAKPVSRKARKGRKERQRL